MITMRTIMENELHCKFTCFCVQPFVKAVQVLGVYFPALHNYLDSQTTQKHGHSWECLLSMGML